MNKSKRVDLDKEAADGLCKFLKSDPIALAHAVIAKRVNMPDTIARLLIQRLFLISGQPVSRERTDCFGIDYYENEGKAEVASLAVKIRGDQYIGGFFDGAICGRNKKFDKDGKYAVTVG